MKTPHAIGLVFAGLAGCLTLGAFADGPVVRDVVVRQRWPWSRLVDIQYVLDDLPARRIDITLSASNQGIPLTLAPQALTGVLWGVTPGTRRIIWDPMKSSYTNEVIGRLRVDIVPSPSPLYMIVDLTKTANDPGRLEYVHEEDLFTNKWGAVTSAWERNPVTNNGTVVESVIWTGVTNDIAFMTEKIVLRRIPAGSFKMGPGVNIPVTLTKEFYMGVFEVTQEQWKRVYGTEPSLSVSNAANPVECVAYDEIRGSAAQGGGGWPTNANVYALSFAGKFMTKTGLAGFDLPTDAQWEYACRAGTTTYYNDGVSASASPNILNGLGWWSGNSGTVGNPGGQTHPVGQKRPNAWGLYDMHGNAIEWCLDWSATLPTAPAPDPAGPVSGTARVLRSGSWRISETECSATWRGSANPAYTFTSQKDKGFRLVMNLP